MIHEDEDLSRLVRESARNRWTIAALGVAWAVAVIANAAAGRGPVDNLLSFVVMVSAFLVLVAYAIRVVTWRRSGGVFRLVGTLPVWFVRLAAGLAATWFAIAVIIVVTP